MSTVAPMSTPSTSTTGTTTVPSAPTARVSRTAMAWIALAVVVLLAGVASFWASSSPDGLESVAATHGFEESATDPWWTHSPFGDYEGAFGVPTWLARVLGTGVVLAVMFLLVRLAARPSRAQR